MAKSNAALPQPVAQSLQKPTLRGVSHQIAFFIAAVAGFYLVSQAHDARAGQAAAIYTASLATMFGASALYHRPTWSPRPRAWMRRLDHAAIFVLIAGTATAFTLPITHGRPIALAVAWGGAAIGILLTLFWLRAPKAITVVIYIALGWTILPFLPQLAHAIGRGGVLLLILGGLLYSTGAVFYARKAPNPFPGIFGYHEIFHALVIAASVCHFVVVLFILRSLRVAL